ncbi:MAG: transcription-repair coupling factor [Elusimicrobia bacterium]|nr:transcription-repair coupling factor [Elusimicrobiota bacterium]
MPQVIWVEGLFLNLELPSSSRNFTGLPNMGARAFWALKHLRENPAAPRHVPLGLQSSLDSGQGLVLHGPRSAAKGAARVFFILKTEEELEDLERSLLSLSLIWEVKPGRVVRFGEDPRDWPAALEGMVQGARLILLLPKLLRETFPAPERIQDFKFFLRPGGSFPRSVLLQILLRFGYSRVSFVEDAGEFAVRGSVVDVYSKIHPGAVRLSFKEDILESIRILDPETQRTSEFCEEALLLPVRWGPSLGLNSSFLSWAGAQDAWLLEDALEEGQKLPGQVFVVEGNASQGSCHAGPLRGASRTSGPHERGPHPLDFGARGNLKFQGNLDLLAQEIKSWKKKEWQVFLFCLNLGEQERLMELLEPRLAPGDCQFLVGPLSEGFLHPADKLVVLAASEIFQRSYRSLSLKPYRTGSSRRYRWTDLKSGDFVVHEDYGVGRFMGIHSSEESRQGPGFRSQDCILVSYRGGDKLYIPLHEFKKIQRYVGAEGKVPRLSSLDRRSWEAVRERVRENVRELAEEILKLEAARAAVPAHPFMPDAHLEKEFEASFPYEETPDQKRTIQEVKKDMQSSIPMNRIVVGDVGFGKTEVAIRAALKCALGYRQTALLVPTTVLADQHFRTFKSRLADYPIRIGMLSRWVAPQEQKKLLSQIRQGSCDIVIGTHRLFQSDVQFKELGLLIIDEEHRFGVRDKERLKALKKNVHTLTLSATPIPRSLYQALSGLRSISLIQSPPAGRLPIVTEVGSWDEEKVVEVIQRELDRGGQVYYVHNRVATLPARFKYLKGLLPEVRFCMAHGKLSTAQLEEAMWEFSNRKFDVLLSSTIIESGLDIPSVNTLVVENAHEFGLAQLYQLRGRVGREKTRAWCYLFYPQKLPLTEEARKRLSALQEFAELGSGFRLAMRDLEIRGAGDLLGARQHGFLNAVGLEMYCDLLNQEVARLRGKDGVPMETPLKMDLRISTYIPEESMPDEMERLNFYKRLLNATPEQCASLKEEFLDLCGEIPEPVENLFSLVALRASAQECQIRSIAQREESVEIYFKPAVSLGVEILKGWEKLYGQSLAFLSSPQGDGIRVKVPGEVSVEWVKNFLSTLKAKC